MDRDLSELISRARAASAGTAGEPLCRQAAIHLQAPITVAVVGRPNTGRTGIVQRLGNVAAAVVRQDRPEEPVDLAVLVTTTRTLVTQFEVEAAAWFKERGIPFLFAATQQAPYSERSLAAFRREGERWIPIQMARTFFLSEAEPGAEEAFGKAVADLVAGSGGAAHTRTVLRLLHTGLDQSMTEAQDRRAATKVALETARNRRALLPLLTNRAQDLGSEALATVQQSLGERMLALRADLAGNPPAGGQGEAHVKRCGERLAGATESAVTAALTELHQRLDKLLQPYVALAGGAPVIPLHMKESLDAIPAALAALGKSWEEEQARIIAAMADSQRKSSGDQTDDAQGADAAESNAASKEEASEGAEDTKQAGKEKLSNPGDLPFAKDERPAQFRRFPHDWLERGKQLVTQVRWADQLDSHRRELAHSVDSALSQFWTECESGLKTLTQGAVTDAVKQLQARLDADVAAVGDPDGFVRQLQGLAEELARYERP